MQQYYVEFGAEMVPDRLTKMLPAVIPDSCLAGSGMIEKWTQMVIAAYRRVSACDPQAIGSYPDLRAVHG